MDINDIKMNLSAINSRAAAVLPLAEMIAEYRSVATAATRMADQLTADLAKATKQINMLSDQIRVYADVSAKQPTDQACDKP